MNSTNARSTYHLHHRTHTLRSLLVAALTAAVLLIPARAIFAASVRATFQPAPATAPVAQATCSTVVTSTANSGVGSLRSAVACVSGGSTVTFAPATFSVPRTITLTAQIPVTRSLIISGPGSSLLTISGNNVTRTLFIDAGAANDVRLFGLTLARGRVSGNGGAVLVQTARSLTISNTKIADSTAMTITGQSNSGNGGGLYISATLPLSLVDSQVTSNTASTAGGLFLGGGATIANSTIASNTAGDGAGVVASATLVISNSTIAANAALNRAGGISPGPEHQTSASL